VDDVPLAAVPTAAALGVPRRARETAVVVEGLTKRFGERTILADVSLHIERREAVALIGANGAGKSTLLRLLVRLLEPDEGEIRILGDPVTGADASRLRALRRRVGFVFQQHNLVGRATVLTNVVHGALGRTSWVRASSHRLASTAQRLEAMRCLERVGLAGLADRRADQISGGQSQRVAIARALMQRPEMLLADEPAASLDPAAGEEVMRVFRRLVDADGLTLVFTSHNLVHARTYADRVIGLCGGGVTMDVAASALDLKAADGLYA
jgi:phosphonate transport system ATP-binding protein